MDAQKLPLMVLYNTGESWFLEKNATPIAIFLGYEEEAVYVKNIHKTNYFAARELCDQMDVENLFWCIPNEKQLQKLLDCLEDFNKTAKLLGVEPMKNGNYWSRRKLFNGIRLGVNFALQKETALAEDEFAFTRPFLRL